jgi:outer membrane protein assembly factor BamB
MPRKTSSLFCLGSVLVSLLSAQAGFAAADLNWPRWRGPHDSGSLPAAKLPTKLDAGQIAWKAPLPGKGCSTPIVWNDRIYVTAPVDGQDALLTFDHAGKQLWKTEFGSEEKGKHRNASGSNPSPVTNGKGIFVTFKSGNLAAVNPDGSVRWHLNLVERFGPLKLFWDFGTSPVLTDRNVIIARMHEGESWLAAFDQQTGELRWKTARNYETPREVDNGYTTPQVIRHAGRDALLTWGAQHLTAHDAANGQLLWSCGDFNPAATPLWPAVASPVVVNDVAVVCFGRADRGLPRLHGIKLGGKGDVTATHRLWQREDTGAFVPTPAAYKGKVYVLSDRGQLDCLDPVSGKTLWSQTFPRASSNFYASPLIAGGIMYAAREDGHVYIARIEGGFELLSEYKFADKIIGSLVPLGDRLLVRGEANLYCIGTP